MLTLSLSLALSLFVSDLILSYVFNYSNTYNVLSFYAMFGLHMGPRGQGVCLCMGGSCAQFMHITMSFGILNLNTFFIHAAGKS